MSDLQRYEEDLAKRLKDLPMPDRKLAWDKMEKLLDEGNDDGGGLPPTTPPSPGNGNTPWGWIILGVVILVAALWFMLHSSKTNQAAVTTTNTTNSTTAGDITISTSHKDDQKISTSGTATTATGYNPKTTTTTTNTTADTTNVQITSSRNKTGTYNTKDQVNKPASDNISKVLAIKNDSSNATRHTIKTDKKITTSVNANSMNDATGVSVKRTGSKLPLKQARIKKAVSVTGKKAFNKKSTAQTVDQTPAGRKKMSLQQKGKMKSHVHRASASGGDTPSADQDTDKISTPVSSSLSTFSKNEPVVADSLTKKDTVAAIAAVKKTKDSTTTVKKTTPDNKKKKAYFAAGLGEQQSIPKATTVSAADYIPSVYLRYYAPKKWFLQADFKYAASEPVNSFIYRSTHDTGQTQSIGAIDTTYKLKAVYYHRFSVSFNYFVKPAWSIGAGLVYNMYSAQTTQTDRNEFIGGITDSLVSSITTKSKSDSGLIGLGNYMQLIIETQYQWKRFSFGANYSVALGSFAKYTNQFTGVTTSKSTNLLTVFIRYELWK